jgi:hypothetical protein
MPTSSIDDLLMGGKSNIHPETPEYQHEQPEDEEEIVDDPKDEHPDYGENESDKKSESPEEDSKEPENNPRETDDYGNEQEPENEAIRERLARQARKHQAEIDSLRAQLANQGASREIQKAASDFEYNPDESGDWQQQLARFVKETVTSMGREEQQTKQLHQEQQLQYEFESKFKAGIEKFHDFAEVVSSLPFEITNPMTLATRAMADPAAFLYAAARRQPEELERISKIRDPYAQMTEMGKLEERMRRNKPTTTAPRPLGRTTEDSSLPAEKKKSEPTIEELIARSDAKKMQKKKTYVLSRR